MTFFNTAVSALLLVCLAISISNGAAHDPSLPTNVAASTSVPANEDYHSDSTANVPTIYVASSSDITINFSTNVADSLDFTVGFLPNNEASDVPARDIDSIISSLLQTPPAPGPFNYASIVYPPADDSVPAHEAQKDRLFVENILQITAHNTDKFLHEVVAKQLKNVETKELSSKCAEICEQMLLSATQTLQKGVANILSKEYYEADDEVNGFSSNIHTCIECFGIGGDLKLQKFKNWATGVTHDCLERIAKYTS